MTLDAHMWGNPETVLQRKQEAEARKHANCGACVHHQSMQVIRRDPHMRPEAAKVRL